MIDFVEVLVVLEVQGNKSLEELKLEACEKVQKVVPEGTATLRVKPEVDDWLPPSSWLIEQHKERKQYENC